MSRSVEIRRGGRRVSEFPSGKSSVVGRDSCCCAYEPENKRMVSMICTMKQVDSEDVSFLAAKQGRAGKKTRQACEEGNLEAHLSCNRL